MDADSDKLIGCLYDGILAPAGWQSALAALRALTNSEQATLLIYNRVTDEILVGEAFGVDLVQLSRYEQEFNKFDPNKINLDKIGLLEWHYDRRELGAEFLRKDYFYQTYMRENGLGGVIYSPLIRENKIVAVISFQRSISRAETSLDDINRIAAFLPHIQRAMYLRYKYQQLQNMAQMSQSVLDRIGVPVFVIKETGKVLLANKKGEDWLTLNGKHFRGQVSLVQADGRRMLEQMAHIVCCSKGMAKPHGIPLQTVNPSKQGYMIGIPLPTSHPLANHWHSRSGLVFIHEHHASTGTVPQIMQCLFGLTPAERRLVDMLAQGMTLADIAEELAVTKETVRSHLKSVFGKTGVSRQSALIRLMHGVARFEQAE